MDEVPVSVVSSGFLCGDYMEGLGVSALLNRCVQCHYASGLLIAALSMYSVRLNNQILNIDTLLDTQLSVMSFPLYCYSW